MHVIGKEIEREKQLDEKVRANLTVNELIHAVIQNQEGCITAEGGVVVNTKPNTGRRPNDKFWTNENIEGLDPKNQLLSREQTDVLRARMFEYLKDKTIYRQNVVAGADEQFQLPIEIDTEEAWQSLFVSNLFRHQDTVTGAQCARSWRVIAAGNFHAVPERDGTNSEAFVVIDRDRKEILIGGTRYAGEIKKAVFTVLNYELPQQDVLSMHCGCNRGEHGDVSLFFGLSGTGKTTLSSDPDRTMIGDDEHGWSDRGVFNIEGGNYAKVIGFRPESEPVIAQAIQGPGVVFENVAFDTETGQLNFDPQNNVENIRAAYSLDAVPNVEMSGEADHPSDIFLLSADAFGVLPPIARLTPEEAVEYYLRGYTAKVAGTEKGVKEPQATFSPGFGGPFLAHRPEVYGQLLQEKIAKHHPRIWLVNTGWTGGPYGVGERMAIEYTRAMIRAAQNGELDVVEMRLDPIFGFQVPCECPNVPAEILDPKKTWADQNAYDAQAEKLREMFENNTGVAEK